MRKDFGQFQSCLSFQLVCVAILIGTVIANLKSAMPCFFDVFFDADVDGRCSRQCETQGKGSISMKGVTIILVGVLLMLGLGTARAATGAYPSNDTMAFAADHAELPLATPELPLATDLNFGTIGDDELLASQSLTVWDYAISAQVTVDLQCRVFASEQSDAELVSNINEMVDVEHITQNLMVGFRYNF
jgi:hypothetical protein